MTTLAQVGDLFELNPAGGGTGPLLELSGGVVTAGQFPAGWTPVGAVQTGNGYEVAWSVPGANEYVVWNTDSNGDYTSAATGILSGTSSELEGVEANFGEDFPGARTPAPTTTIATNGTTTLAQVGNLYELNPAGGGTGPLLELNGSVVTAGQFSAGWTPVGAEKTASGYEVAWSVLGANEYAVWNTDSNGDYTSSATGVVSGQSFALEDLEPAFGEDLNGDGRLSAVLVTSAGPGGVVDLSGADAGRHDQSWRQLRQRHCRPERLQPRLQRHARRHNPGFRSRHSRIWIGAVQRHRDDHELRPRPGRTEHRPARPPSSALQFYDTTVDGLHAISIASGADPAHGLVLLNMPSGDTAALLQASHTTLIGGHALIT